MLERLLLSVCLCLCLEMSLELTLLRIMLDRTPSSVYIYQLETRQLTRACHPDRKHQGDTQEERSQIYL